MVIRVANVASLAAGQSKSFVFRRDGSREEGFVLRHRRSLVAYANLCPHWHVDLDLGDGRFYAADLDRIYCKNHGALFVPETGYCDFGPCFGERLERFELELTGEDALIQIPGAEPLPP